MVTDDNRVYALAQAPLIYQKMLRRGDYRIASKLTSVEVLRRGLLTECAFANLFHLPIRTEIFEYGDGGIDFVMRLRTRFGIEDITVNVKSKSVQRSWPGLRAAGTVLNVPVRECCEKRIYVFGIYLEPTDDAEVLKWEWGDILIRLNKQDSYKNGTGIMNYTKPYDDLRELQELHDRRVWQ